MYLAKSGIAEQAYMRYVSSPLLTGSDAELLIVRRKCSNCMR